MQKAPEGFEPSTLRLLGVRSNQLSYGAPIMAALAQLGERQTEDLKVPGSIPGGGTFPVARDA